MTRIQEELFEMTPPYWAKGEKPPKHWRHTLDFFFSEKAMEREFDILDSFDLAQEIEDVSQILLVSRKEGSSSIYGIYMSTNEFEEKGYKVLFLLEFKSKTTLRSFPSDIPRRKLFQVKKVYTEEAFHGLGIGSYVYQLLVKKGLWILADMSQFDGGKGLWEKLARRSHLSDYQIRIIDDEQGYMKDKQGKVISYDSSNVSEDDIWTTLLDFSGEHKLLLISPLLKYDKLCFKNSYLCISL